MHLKTPTSSLDPPFARLSWLELPQLFSSHAPFSPASRSSPSRTDAAWPFRVTQKESLLPRQTGSAHLSSSPRRTPIGLPVWGTAPVVGPEPGAQEPGRDAQAWGFTFHPGRNLRRAPVMPPSWPLPPTHRSVKLKHDPGSWLDLHRRDLALTPTRLADSGPRPPALAQRQQEHRVTSC